MESIAFSGAGKAARYRERVPQLASLFEGEPDLIANLANATAAIRACVPAASWDAAGLQSIAELLGALSW